jgi:RimJ/RimL family protein N-acetyltransferase
MMPDLVNLEVRPAERGCAGDLVQWLRASSDRDETHVEEAVLRDLIADDPCAALIARVGGSIVGALCGSRTSFGYRIDLLRADPPHLEAVVAALLTAIEIHSAGRMIEALLSLDADADEASWRALGLAGYHHEFDELCVERSLADIDVGGPDPFEYRALSEISRDRLVVEMTRCALEPGFDAETEAEEIIHMAGPDLDRDLWTVVYHEARAIGVLLLHRLPYEPPLGAILFMGIIPEARGRGLGRALHRAALLRLARAGSTEYIDATRVSNLAMQRIFAAHGCRTTGMRRTFRKLILPHGESGPSLPIVAPAPLLHEVAPAPPSQAHVSR